MNAMYYINDLLTALDLLYKIVKNIADKPNEEKYRQIKTTNKTLKQKLFKIK